MTRLIARTLLVLTAMAVIVAPSTAGAGGWAVSSLDPLPPMEAGDDVEIGFTVLQHGVRPVALADLTAGGETVGLTVTDAAGDEAFFPAMPEGAVGHYVATITVPAAGVATLSTQMGWFGSSPPVEIEVSPVTSGRGWPAWTGVALPAVAVACLMVVVLDVLSASASSACSRSRRWHRRRRRTDDDLMRPRLLVAGAGALVALALTPVAWANSDSGGAVSTPQPIDGASLFAAKGCSSCHIGPDSTPMVAAGPSLALAPSWAGDRIEGLTAAEYVEQSIRQPGSFISPAASAGGPAGPLHADR